MNASLLAVLSDAERLLVAQTEPAELAALDFEEALSRASRRVAVLARQSAARLRAERIAASWTCRVHAGMNRRRARHPKRVALLVSRRAASEQLEFPRPQHRVLPPAGRELPVDRSQVCLDRVDR